MINWNYSTKSRNYACTGSPLAWLACHPEWAQVLNVEDVNG